MGKRKVIIGTGRQVHHVMDMDVNKRNEMKIKNDMERVDALMGI